MNLKAIERRVYKMWLVPSRRRVEKLTKFADSLKEAETSTPGIVIVDSKDYTENAHVYSDIQVRHLPSNWKIHVSTAEGMGPKIREMWSRVEDRPWVGVLNDDHRVVTKEWDVKLINQLNGRNFLTCNDRWNAPMRAAGATLFSMELVKAFGFPLFPPQIDHLGIDDVWETIGRQTGCWKVDMSVVVEHAHVFKDQKPDGTHLLVYGKGPWAGSKAQRDTLRNLSEFYKVELPGVVARVRALSNAKTVSIPT